MYYATGQSLNVFLFQNLTIPTGISGAYVPVGYNNVFFSKARSMARFGLLVLNQGVWNGDPIMSDANYFNDMVNTSQSLNLSYGYLWWLNGKPSFMLPSIQTVFPGPLNPSAPADLFAALGKDGQLINVVPSMGLVFIRMGNAPNTSQAVSPTFNDTIWQHLNDLMCTNTSVLDQYLDDDLELNVYPNPAENMVQVRCAHPIQRIRLTDNLGKLVWNRRSDGLTSIDVNVASFTPGVYVLQATLENGSVVAEKLIIH